MVTYRKLLPTEFPLYKEHLLQLETVDRYSRFSGTVSPEFISRRVETLDWSRVVLIGAFLDGLMVGAAELCTDRALWPGEAELALSIDRGMQGHGIGSRLGRRALMVARNRGIAKVHMICLASNRRIQALGRRLGGAVTLESSDAEILFKLPPPDQLSLAQEALDSSVGFFGAVIGAALHPALKLSAPATVSTPTPAPLAA